MGIMNRWQLRLVNIMDSMADKVGLPDLGIGWEATSDVSLMRIPGPLEKSRNVVQG